MGLPEIEAFYSNQPGEVKTPILSNFPRRWLRCDAVAGVEAYF